ncbi:MAG: STAS domain-containing protein [Pseudomonadota bacterium]|nr:STAS domain-containing protein [Pseudomonadota bacterium]
MLTLPPVLTHAASAAFARGLPQAVQSSPGELVADASALQQFDSSALAVLLECRRQATATGKAFSVHGAPVRLRELASLYGVAELIPGAAPASA